MTRLEKLKTFFLHARSGLAAVEFAFILPVMVSMFFGTVELTTALACRADVTSLASTAADLVAQQSQITNTDMANVFAALNEVLYPYDTSKAKIVITSLVDDGKNDGMAKVAWSDEQNSTARTVGTFVAVPSGLIASGGSVILAEVSYAYDSTTTHYITGPINMTNSFYAHPRQVPQISRVSS
jgi:Flp pilus assembly protein TadG